MDQKRQATGDNAPLTTIQSVETAFRIIESLKDLGEPGVSAVADHTGLAKSTAHKHLNTLLQEGYVVKDGDRYRLGSRFLDIGGHYRETYYGSATIKSRIQELAEETGEVAHFAVEEQGRAIVLYREGGKHGVPTRSRIGKRMYMHQTAYGKAIMAHLPEHKARAIVDVHGLPGATENTVTDQEELAAELEEIRERGYAVNSNESTQGLRAIGVPVLLNDGEVYGGCSIAGPELGIDDEAIDILLRLANQLELEINYS